MPRLAVTAKDLEDRDSRFALRALVDELVFASEQEPPELRAGVVRLRGKIDVDLLHSLSGELETAPLGAVTPWVINAHLLGTTIAYDGTENDVARPATAASCSKCSPFFRSCRSTNFIAC